MERPSICAAILRRTNRRSVEPTVTFEVLEVIKGQYSGHLRQGELVLRRRERPEQFCAQALAGACWHMTISLAPIWFEANPKSGDYRPSRASTKRRRKVPWLDAVVPQAPDCGRDWRVERHAQATAANVQTQSGDQHLLAQDMPPELTDALQEFRTARLYRHPKASAQDRLVALYAMAMKPAWKHCRL